MWDFDETGFIMGLIQSGMVVTGLERQGRPKTVQSGNRKWINAIPVILKHNAFPNFEGYT